MKMRRLLLVLTLALLLCSRAATAEKSKLESGPQPGDNLPGPYHSLVAHSEDSRLVGTKTDFSEMYGPNPVVLIFAREMSKPLTRLVKKLDAEVARRKSARLGAVVVLLSDDEALEKDLADLARKQGIKKVNLAIMVPGHYTTRQTEKRYKLSKEAEVTVVMYTRRKVVANHAFQKGKLDKKGTKAILADVPRISSRE
jgi:hypothetical protein